jgi:hypothetical protein
MADFHLPARDAKTLAKISKLPSAQISSLMDALRAVEPQLWLSTALQNAVASFAKKNGIAAADVSRIAKTVVLTRLRNEMLTDADFVTSIVASAEEELEAEDFNRKGLQTAIVNLIALDNLNVSIKATLLARESKFHIHTCNIISDVRPVFSREREEVQGLFVASTLKIEYSDAEENVQTMFFALDEGDIESLTSALFTLKKKRKALKALLSKLPTRVLE